MYKMVCMNFVLGAHRYCLKALHVHQDSQFADDRDRTRSSIEYWQILVIRELAGVMHMRCTNGLLVNNLL